MSKSKNNLKQTTEDVELEDNMRSCQIWTRWIKTRQNMSTDKLIEWTNSSNYELAKQS